MLKGFTAQPKGTTAKHSGTQKNLDSSRPIGPTTRLKGNTMKPSGILKTSDPERSVGHTAQPKGTTAKPSGNTAQPKGNTAKPSGITKHQENKNRLHVEKQNTPSETRYKRTSIKRRAPKGSTAKPTCRTAKPTGDHLMPGTPATGQAAISSTAVGESSAQKRKGKTNVFALNKTNTTTEYIITTHIQTLSTKMTKYIFSVFSAMKPASVSWGTPPRGEPGEPRPTGLRTLSSQQRGATNAKNNSRFRNHNRGIRSPGKVLDRQQRANHNKLLSRAQTREYRTSTPLETRHRLARCVLNSLF